MRYQGGKSKIAKPIANIIDATNNLRGGILVSLFCGTCSVESRVQSFKHIICNDNHEYLIEMLKGVQSGYELPNTVTEEQYKHIKANPDRDKILTGFVGIACSFGGKWFGGYGKSSTGRNFADEGKRSLMKDMKNLKNAIFVCKDYRNVVLPDGCIVYADPPYDGTTNYRNQPFNSNEFWEYVREISKRHIVFVSEQNAPDDFVSVWQQNVTRTLNANKSNQPKVTEKLYVHKQHCEGECSVFMECPVS